MRRVVLASALLAMTALLAPRDAQATVVLRASLEELTHGSELVVHGTVETVKARQLEGPRVRIVTDVTVRVAEAFKGRVDEKTITFTTPGGTVGKWASAVPGAPRWVVGEELVLFLERTPAGLVVSGLSQGKLGVVREPVSGRLVAVEQRADGIELVTRDESGALVPLPGSPTPLVRYLDELRVEVRTLARVPRPAVPSPLQTR